MRERVLLRSGRVDDVVGVLHLLLKRHLPAEPVKHLFAREMVAGHRPLNLLPFIADCDNEPGVLAITTRLYQYRSFGDGDAIGLALRKLLDQLLGERHVAAARQQE